MMEKLTNLFKVWHKGNFPSLNKRPLRRVCMHEKTFTYNFKYSDPHYIQLSSDKMNCIRKASQFPMKSFAVSGKQQGVLFCGENGRFGIGNQIGNIAIATAASPIQQIQNNDNDCDRLEIVQLTSPIELRQNLGIDKIFVEKHEETLVMFAVTKKLLEEEKLRRDLQDVNVSIHSIVKQHYRSKPSKLRPVCPLTCEEI